MPEMNFQGTNVFLAHLPWVPEKICQELKSFDMPAFLHKRIKRCDFKCFVVLDRPLELVVLPVLYWYRWI